MGVHGYERVFVGEFSEYRLETRVKTSADFNTYPIRIFIFSLSIRKNDSCTIFFTHKLVMNQQKINPACLKYSKNIFGRSTYSFKHNELKQGKNSTLGKQCSVCFKE